MEKRWHVQKCGGTTTLLSKAVPSREPTHLIQLTTNNSERTLFQNKTSLEAFQLLFMLYQAQSLLTNFAPVSGIFTVVVATIDEAKNE